MLTTGTKGKAEVKVDDTNTAVTMGSGSLKVFATPAMIALIEKAACKALEGQLEDGQTTVGTKLDVAHVAATPGRYECYRRSGPYRNRQPQTCI